MKLCFDEHIFAVSVDMREEEGPGRGGEDNDQSALDKDRSEAGTVCVP